MSFPIIFYLAVTRSGRTPKLLCKGKELKPSGLGKQTGITALACPHLPCSGVHSLQGLLVQPTGVT